MLKKRSALGPAQLCSWLLISLSMYRNSNVLVAGGAVNHFAAGATANYVSGDSVERCEHGFRRLEEHVIAGALHNSGEVSDQPKCHPGTRVAILRHLQAWAAALTYMYPIVWLHGPAGSGKSSILRTVAQILFDWHLLIASFFFFRSSSGRSSSENFITTIAYQLAISIPPTRPYIEEAIESNPLILSLSLWEQAQALIISPILAVHRDNPADGFHQFPRLIVVDGLDECRDPDKQCEILRVLCRILKEVPIPLAVLIASRPEHHIRDAFLSGELNKSTSQLSLDDSYNADADIRQYLDGKFSEIRQRHRAYLPTSPWPSPKVIDALVAKASGQFIYVSTVVKFVGSPRHNPAKRLDIILGSIDAGRLKPFEQLDMLYSTIFLNIDDDIDQSDVLRVLGALLVPYDTSGRGSEIPRVACTPEFLERLLNLDAGDTRRLLFDLESLLTLGNDDEPIRFFHASLGDYLFDGSRSGQFWIDAGKVYADLAQHSTIHLHNSKNWIELKQLFHGNGLLFFSKAAPTPELRTAIESCDFSKISDFSVWAPASGSLTTDISPTLLQAIRNSAFADASVLYLNNLALYSQILRPRIQVYFQDICLARLLIAAASTEVPDIDSKGTRDHYQYLRLIFKVSDEMWNVQKRKGLCLEYSSLALIQAIKELLDDDLNSNVGYFIDENQYADTALCLLEFLSQDPGFVLGGISGMEVTPQSNLVGSDTVERMTKILPVLLSKSPIRNDVLARVKANPVHSIYLEFSSVNEALEAYISVRNNLAFLIVPMEHQYHLPTAISGRTLL
ncbi:hypothetical protein GALMADRAFT_236936 [Galerina marginata CBS 339.88]|uniref:NACHT domain-containing protein n=1 Tax=Galerina marginata (strain CBS 339.88) TaxID=685588 RepID=A0A067TYU8_GALM3|nr:hypothetical protein GALMADRAFT_236936 [Galerina marginata CBS 339.88]